MNFGDKYYDQGKFVLSHSFFVSTGNTLSGLSLCQELEASKKRGVCKYCGKNEPDPHCICSIPNTSHFTLKPLRVIGECGTPMYTAERTPKPEYFVLYCLYRAGTCLHQLKKWKEALDVLLPLHLLTGDDLSLFNAVCQSIGLSYLNWGDTDPVDKEKIQQAIHYYSKGLTSKTNVSWKIVP